MHNFWIYVAGEPVATTVTLTWAMQIAEAMARYFGDEGGAITINDYQGKTVYP